MTELLIKRPCLLVADLARSLLLYQDILGFKLTYQSAANPGSYLYTLFELPAEAALTFASLDSEADERVLALTEVKGVSLPELTQPRSASVIQVRGLSEAIARAEGLGLRTYPPNTFSTRPQVQFTEQVLIDFDGHRLVLYESVAVAG